MSNNIILILWSLGGYLLGSIPFGMLRCLLFGYGDIRRSGSGNIGATNVLRVTGSKILALLTILFDASKAGLIAYAALKLTPARVYMFYGFLTGLNVMAALIGGTMAVIGHNFPVWLKFKGGKGVASSFGLILAVAPAVALGALLVWIIAAIIFRYSSLAALIAAIAAPLMAFFYASPVHTVFISALALLLLERHHSNIVRLAKGEESTISFKKSDGKFKSQAADKPAAKYVKPATIKAVKSSQAKPQKAAAKPKKITKKRNK